MNEQIVENNKLIAEFMGGKFKIKELLDNGAKTIKEAVVITKVLSKFCEEDKKPKGNNSN